MKITFRRISGEAFVQRLDPINCTVSINSVTNLYPKPIRLFRDLRQFVVCENKQELAGLLLVIS